MSFAFRAPLALSWWSYTFPAAVFTVALFTFVRAYPFPYADWLGWKLFWGPVPVLFYFREQQSIHLLPVLFDATSLREQLNRHISAQP